MHGNLSSCAESVFIAARRPRGVARERENGEERVASNPERQLNPCTRPRPFLHNTYVQPRRRLRTSPTPVAKGAKRVCVTAAFADDPLFSPPCLEKSFPNDRCDIFRGRKSGAVAQNRNEAWREIDRRFSKQNLERFFFSRRFPSRRGVRGLEITVTVPWFRVDSMTRSEKAGLLPTFPTDTF